MQGRWWTNADIQKNTPQISGAKEDQKSSQDQLEAQEKRKIGVFEMHMECLGLFVLWSGSDYLRLHRKILTVLLKR